MISNRCAEAAVTFSGVVGRAAAKPTRQIYLVFEGLSAGMSRRMLNLNLG